LIGQMQVLDVADLSKAKLKLEKHKTELLALADEIDPVLKKIRRRRARHGSAYL